MKNYILSVKECGIYRFEFLKLLFKHNDTELVLEGELAHIDGLPNDEQKMKTIRRNVFIDHLPNKDELSVKIISMYGASKINSLLELHDINHPVSQVNNIFLANLILRQFLIEVLIDWPILYPLDFRKT